MSSDTKPTLYTHPMSPHGNIVVDFLAAAGLIDAVEQVTLDFAKGEHKAPAFLAVNPTGQISGLRDGDVCVFESDAIIRYLALRFRSPLLPHDDIARYAAVDSVQTHIRQKAWDHGTGLVFHKIMRKRFTGQDGDPARIQACEDGLDKTLGFIGDTWFKSGGDWMLGAISTADTTLATLLSNAKRAGYTPKHPRVQAFHAHWCAQPFYVHSPYAKDGAPASGSTV